MAKKAKYAASMMPRLKLLLAEELTRCDQTYQSVSQVR